MYISLCENADSGSVGLHFQWALGWLGEGRRWNTASPWGSPEVTRCGGHSEKGFEVGKTWFNYWLFCLFWSWTSCLAPGSLCVFNLETGAIIQILATESQRYWFLLACFLFTTARLIFLRSPFTQKLSSESHHLVNYVQTPPLEPQIFNVRAKVTFLSCSLPTSYSNPTCR